MIRPLTIGEQRAPGRRLHQPAQVGFAAVAGGLNFRAARHFGPRPRICYNLPAYAGADIYRKRRQWKTGPVQGLRTGMEKV